ncbi:coiled-coil domain-containing protein 62 isoform X1 [Heliangelus exortis]|uniref:coiled-coil domain-containing protein 62 isoform X1 n=1 Tax=Heliangelus exortis TaxID=472823 RepID=UPI003A90A37B
MNPSVPRSASAQDLSPNLEDSTIQKQRRELQLLIAELKDRDRELDDMVAVHQRQLLAWEDDRQKILTLAERCNLLSNELNKRNEVIKSQNKRLKFLESQQNKATLEKTKQKFKELSQKVTDATVLCQALEEKNQSLHCSVLELSAKTGQLQAREQELLTMLKLKDGVLLEAADHISEFTSKFKKLADALVAAKMEEFSLSKEKQNLSLRLKELTLETNKLKDDLSEKMKENNKQQEEITHLRQENDHLRNELTLHVEGAKRKDQLLQSAKSKQARMDTELSSLRQICVKQQRDLEFLHVNLESSQELRQEKEKVAHETSIGLAFSAPESNSETDTVRTEGSHRMCEECGNAQVPKSRVKPTSEVCEVDNRLLLNASYLEEATLEYFNVCQKVVKVLAVLTEEEEKQDVASSSGEPGSKVFCEANNTRPLENREISEDGVESRDQQSFDSSLPECECCLNVSSRVDLQSALIQSTITSAKTDNENKSWEERTSILFSQKIRETPAAVPKSESDSCSNNSTIKNDAQSKAVSELEWLRIFKPTKGDGSTQHGKDCSCLETAQEMKCANSKSEENVDLDSFHLDSPCLTATQSRERLQRCEKFSVEDSPLKISDLSATKPENRSCSATMDQDTNSPVRQLQQALAESRQMVADLELSTLLHCSPNSSSINLTTEPVETPHRTQLSAAEESGPKLSLFSL